MSKPVTEAELAKMEEIDKTAIEAEWSFKDWRNGDPVQICKQYEGADWVGVAFIAGAHGTSLDAYTLVSAVKDRSTLIAEVRRLRGALTELANEACAGDAICSTMEPRRDLVIANGVDPDVCQCFRSMAREALEAE